MSSPARSKASFPTLYQYPFYVDIIRRGLKHLAIHARRTVASALSDELRRGPLRGLTRPSFQSLDPHGVIAEDRGVPIYLLGQGH